MNFNINKAAVLGAGVMGAGIAVHVACSDIPVVLLDIVPKELTEEEKAQGLTLESQEFRNRFAQNGKDRVLNSKFVSTTNENVADLITVGNFEDHLSLIQDCDWIIEVILEDLEVKKTFFKDVVKHRKPGSIVTTNTSGISINKIVEEMPTEFKQHFLGTHFFNPPTYQKLLELIPNEETLPELMEFMSDFGENRLEKGIVLAKDTPAFIANRIGMHALITAVRLTEKYGFDISTADQLTGSIICRPKSATFRTLDLVGIDTFKLVENNNISAIADEDETRNLVSPDFIQELIAKNQLGDKTGSGFYKKVKLQEGSMILAWDYKAGEYLDLERKSIDALKEAEKESNPLAAFVYGESEESNFVWEVLKNTLLYSAGKVPEITDDYKAIDKSMIWGYNWEKGPFEVWDMIGFERSVNRMVKEGANVPEWIEKRLIEGQSRFYE